MDITTLKSEYHVDGDLEKQLDNIYPLKSIIYVPIKYVENTGEGWIDYSSNKAVSLTIEVERTNYQKEDVKNAMKIACLRFLEEFC